MNFFSFLNENFQAISVLALVVGGIWALIKFREYLKDKRFKTYHELIDELVNEQRSPDRKIKLDRQIAIIYELRNFPPYFPLSKRILSDLKNLWKEQPRIEKEINLSLDFMGKRWFGRILVRVFRKY